MLNTLVVQSHRSPLPYPWLKRCLASVRDWCERNRYDYQFLGNELFDSLPTDLREKLDHQFVIAADLARLKLAQDALNQGYETFVWLDADFLIFNPENFILPDKSYAVGREVWVQYDNKGELKVYKKVHNAFLMFRQTNSFLAFYTEVAERLLRHNQGSMPPKYIGPKLLTALHNVVQLPVMESAGMLSPLVIKDIVNGKGEALQLFNRQSACPVTGANLCISSRDRQEVSCSEMEHLIALLTDRNNKTLLN